MKTRKLIDLERQRVEIVNEAREGLHAIGEACDAGKDPTKLEKRHDAIIRRLDLIDLDISEERMAAEDEEARAKARPNMGATEAWGVDDGRPDFPSGWTDQRGKPVRVLERNQRFSTGGYRGMTFGDHVRALAVGPRNEDEKRALSEGTASEGGYTVPAPLAAEFIDRLRAKSCAIRAGARTVPMTSNSLAIARLDTDPTVTWRLENALIDASDPTFSRVLLEAKAVAGIVKVSRELLADSVNVSEMLSNAFAQQMALELDRVAIWGDGTDDGPIGITGTSGINEVSMGNNGAALANGDKLLDAIYEMSLDNSEPPTGMVMHPRTELALDKLKDGNGMPMTFPDKLVKLPRFVTTAASIAETQGSANNASSIVFGNFRELFIGMRDEMSITVLKERYADYGQVGFLCWMRADVQLAHKASFCRLKGIIP